MIYDLTVYLYVLCLCTYVILCLTFSLQTHAHLHIHLAAVLCVCNEQHALSDCRFEGWTCTINTAIGGCFTRMKLLENGSITRDVGCVLSKWNPTFCNEGRTTETYAVECCDDRDRCNDHLTPSFAIPPTPSPAPTLGTYLPPSVVIQGRTAQDVGSGAPSALQPGPTPSSSPVENPPGEEVEHTLSHYKIVNSDYFVGFHFYKLVVMVFPSS